MPRDAEAANSTDSTAHSLRRRLAWLSGAAAAFAVGVSLLVLVGWSLGNEVLVRVVPLPGAGVMMPNSAIGFLLSGAALRLLWPAGSLPRARRIAGRLLAVAGLVLGLLVLAEYALDADLGIDLLLFPDTVTQLAHALPGRPAPSTAVCFALVGLALLALDFEVRAGRRPAQLLALAVGFVALQALAGYGYAAPELYAPAAFGRGPSFTPMAIHTALTFLVLALGILFARPDRGIMEVFTGADAGGFVARRLLPAAILIPLVLGWLRLASERAGLVDTAAGTALLVVAIVVLLGLIIGRSAGALRRLDEARARSVEAQRASEARFRGIFEGAGIGITLADAEGRLLAVNPTFEQMLGYTEAELVGLPYLEITWPDDLAVGREEYRALVGGSLARYQVDKRYRRKDGTAVWARLTVSRVEGAAGAVQAIGMIEDVTERVEVEEERRRFSAIVEATPDLVAVGSVEGRVQSLNPAGRRLVGIPDDLDVTSLSVADFHPPEVTRLVVREAIPKALRDGSWRGETTLRALDGRLIPVLQVILSHRTASGEVECLSTVMRDISDRKRQEESQRFLAEAGRRLGSSLDAGTILDRLLRSLVPGLADYCLIDRIGEDGQIERVGALHARPEAQAAVERLGAWPLAAEQLLGPAEVLRSGEPQLVAEVTPAWLRAVSRDEAHRACLEALGAKSEVMVPLSAGGEVLGVVTLGRTDAGRRYGPEDLALAVQLTERAAVALENARLFHESQQATHLRDEVLRVVAHDLRSPLRTVSVYADLLLDEEKDEEAREHLEIILQAAERGAHLIEDLLDVARMEAGSLAVNPEPLEVAPLVEEALAQARALALEKGLAVAADVPRDLPRVAGDRERLMQVFSNLLGNAIKFSPPGGRVSMRVAQVDGEVRWSVSDTGPGIPEALQPRLFEPFWQALGGTREGAGLGLPIAKGIVEAHGGRIWVETAEGQGSTFHFTVPLAEDAEGFNPAEAARNEASGGRDPGPAAGATGSSG